MSETILRTDKQENGVEGSDNLLKSAIESGRLALQQTVEVGRGTEDVSAMDEVLKSVPEELRGDVEMVMALSPEDLSDGKIELPIDGSLRITMAGILASSHPKANNRYKERFQKNNPDARIILEHGENVYSIIVGEKCTIDGSREEGVQSITFEPTPRDTIDHIEYGKTKIFTGQEVDTQNVVYKKANGMEVTVSGEGTVTDMQLAKFKKAVVDLMVAAHTYFYSKRESRRG